MQVLLWGVVCREVLLFVCFCGGIALWRIVGVELFGVVLCFVFGVASGGGWSC